jgi:WD40 repeat protein
VRAFDIAPNGQWLVIASDSDHMTGGTDGSVVRRVNRETGAVAWTRERSYNAPDHDPDAALNSIVISPNGKYIVLQSYSSQLIVLDAATGRELFRPFASRSASGGSWALPGGLAFSKDGKTLVSRSGPRVLVWDATSLQ